MNFTDTKNNVWQVDVTVLTCKRFKKFLNIDLFDLEAFFKLVQDPISLCDMLYVACRDEADKRGITDEMFGASLGGTVIRDARNALMEAYINFIPDPAAAEKVRVVREKYEKVGEKILASLENRLPEIVKQIDEQTDAFIAELEKEIDKELGIEPAPTITGH
jgi:SpoVK/Ycf46/Vps4 family AAA+-type ATPase